MRLHQATVPDFFPSSSSRVWPAQWISAEPASERLSQIVAYRLVLSLEKKTTFRVHLSADQRYRFHVNGTLEGSGPECGDPSNWYYQTHDLVLSEGTHTLVAIVWTFAKLPGVTPGAIMSHCHGFLLAADAPHTKTLSTGDAPWEFRRVGGVSFRPSRLDGAGRESGAETEITGRDFPWGIERGEGLGWLPAAPLGFAREGLSSLSWGTVRPPLIAPGNLPALVADQHRLHGIRYVGRIHEVEPDTVLVSDAQRLPDIETSFQEALRNGVPLRIGERENLWILFDLDDYYCGYSRLVVKGGQGARIDVQWAESLFHGSPKLRNKGDRNAIDGKLFYGRGDTYFPEGGDECRAFSTFTWCSGRYVALFIETADEAVTIFEAGFQETRYPLKMRARITLEDAAFEKSKGLMWRGVQMCAHETYVDCPYYEQLNYVADTRIQALISYTMSGDDRLARRCMELFAASMLPSGLTQARYPSVHPQVIPQFSLFWVAMLHDFAVWRADGAWLRKFLPNARRIIDTFLHHVGEDGLLRCPNGWDWVDWAYERGTPPQGPEGASAANHLQLIHIMGLAEQLEQWIGKESAAREYAKERERLWHRALEVYWSDERGLFASTSSHDQFCEQPQCYAVLTGLLDGSRMRQMAGSLENDENLTRATPYFQFYLFAAYSKLNLPHLIVDHHQAWLAMAEAGLKTTTERHLHNARSDCHAWSAHPLYHAVHSLCGIRPVGFGFRVVAISPAFAALPSADAAIPHPGGGFVRVAWHHEENGGRLHVQIELPAEIEAIFEFDGESHRLKGGAHRFQKSLVTSS